MCSIPQRPTVEPATITNTKKKRKKLNINAGPGNTKNENIKQTDNATIT